jgi:hypothetical protein
MKITWGLLLQIFTMSSVLAFTGTSYAANWHRYKTCKTYQGEFELDRATDGPWSQIVIRDNDLIRFIVDKGAIDKGDLDFDNHQLVLGTYNGGSPKLHFVGDATVRAGKAGLDISEESNGVRVSSTIVETYKCYCDGYVNGDSECVGTYRCPDPIVLFDFLVTDCRSN